MKKRVLAVFFFYFLLLVNVFAQQNHGRTTIDLNNNWQFSMGEDSSQWNPVTLPHDWSIALPYSKENTASSTGFLPGGIGWYKRTFTIPANEKDRHVSIEFDGIYNNSTVWLNGQKLGERPSGYSSFSYDLTGKLIFGQNENILVVKVDHSHYADSRWYTGSGIYRNVRLIKTSASYIPQWGIQVTTPMTTKTKAAIVIKTNIVRDTQKDIPEFVANKYHITEG